MQAKSHSLPRPAAPVLAGSAPVSEKECEALYTRAMDFLRQGLALRAAGALAGLAQLQPANSRIYRGLGLACHHLQQYGVAYLAYGAALQLDPTDLCARVLRAECAMFVLSPEEARNLLLEAAQGQPRKGDEERFMKRAQMLLAQLTPKQATKTTEVA